MHLASVCYGSSYKPGEIERIHSLLMFAYPGSCSKYLPHIIGHNFMFQALQTSRAALTKLPITRKRNRHRFGQELAHCTAPVRASQSIEIRPGNVSDPPVLSLCSLLRTARISCRQVATTFLLYAARRPSVVSEEQYFPDKNTVLGEKGRMHLGGMCI